MPRRGTWLTFEYEQLTVELGRDYSDWVGPSAFNQSPRAADHNPLVLVNDSVGRETHVLGGALSV